MKKALVLLLAFVLLFATMPLTAFAYETDLGKIEEFDKSNGDGYTPYNLQWEDGSKGWISFNVQKEDFGADKPYTLVLFYEGQEMAATGVGSYCPNLQGEANIAEFMRYPGEYVFVLYMADANNNMLGVESKSPVYVLGEEGIVEKPPMVLEVDIRSKHQAVFTITDPGFPDAYVGTNSGCSFSWELSFESYRFTISCKPSPGELPSTKNIELFTWHDQWGSSLTGFHSQAHIEDNKMIIEIRGIRPGTEFQDTVVPKEFDLREVENFYINRSPHDMECELDHREVLAEEIFAAADVADTRNWGQIYRIDRTWEVAHLVQGNMDRKDYEELYFSPESDNYVIAQAHITDESLMALPEYPSSFRPGNFVTDVTILAWFDESDTFKGMVQRFSAPERDMVVPMLDAWRGNNMANSTAAFFYDDAECVYWVYRPIVLIDDANYGPPDLPKSTDFWGAFVAMFLGADGNPIERAPRKDEFIAAIQTPGHFDLYYPFEIIENHK